MLFYKIHFVLHQIKTNIDHIKFYYIKSYITILLKLLLFLYCIYYISYSIYYTLYIVYYIQNIIFRILVIIFYLLFLPTQILRFPLHEVADHGQHRFWPCFPCGWGLGAPKCWGHDGERWEIWKKCWGKATEIYRNIGEIMENDF